MSFLRIMLKPMAHLHSKFLRDFLVNVIFLRTCLGKWFLSTILGFVSLFIHFRTSLCVASGKSMKAKWKNKFVFKYGTTFFTKGLFINFLKDGVLYMQSHSEWNRKVFESKDSKLWVCIEIKRKSVIFCHNFLQLNEAYITPYMRNLHSNGFERTSSLVHSVKT